MDFYESFVIADRGHDAAIGVVASLSFMFKQRRELLTLKKELRIKSHTSTMDQIAE